jgi:hypothetical protein
MRRSPVDPDLKLALKRIARERRGYEQTIWIGFDNRDHLATPGPPLNRGDLILLNTTMKSLCYKAVMQISMPEVGRVRATTVLLGSGEAFALNVYDRGEYWAEPDQMDLVQLSQIRLWIPE